MLLAQFVDAALPAPDDYDLENTAAYAATLQRLDVPLLDHLLVGGEGDHSMRDRGELLMERLQPRSRPRERALYGAAASRSETCARARIGCLSRTNDGSRRVLPQSGHQI